ncbi:Ku protein [Streptomyces sp. NPDC059009]|uniref:non-homologous end joining protein Ku n=1 Tax=Streptomyces sp. NPDC059009 TaxID=3346694 RepID=UPI0036CB3155
MPRPIWNGYISFGLVSVPTRVYPATEPRAVPLHLIHADDHSRVRLRRVCELDGQEVARHDITRGYETPSGIIPVSDADLDSLPLPTARAIELVAVVPASRITPLQVGAASYYLGTDDSPAAAKPYVLLREALRRQDSVAIVKFAFRDRERLGMLRAIDDTLTLHALRWGDELREPTADLAPAHQAQDLDEDEVLAALDLVDMLSVDSLDDVPDLHDHYREALQELIADKARGRAPAGADEQPVGGRVVDLMAALQQSVQDARTARGETGPGDSDEAAVHALTAHTRKKTVSKKAPVKKAAAKKTTSKRAAKKPPRSA